MVQNEVETQKMKPYIKPLAMNVHEYTLWSPFVCARARVTAELHEGF